MIKTISYGINMLAIIIVIVIGILNMESFSFEGAGILAWTISPYLLSSYIIMKASELKTLYITSILSICIAILGVWMLIYALYIQNDAQSALVFFVIPMYQWMVLLLITVMTYFIRKFTK
jgi:hypothetical protein